MAHASLLHRGFFKDEHQDYEARLILGSVSSGAGDAGEILATFAHIEDGSARSWADAWVARADELHRLADEAGRAGHRTSAGDRHLRASAYYAHALNALAGTDDSDRLLAVFRRHRESWDAFSQVATPAIHPVTIPYEEGALPGYLAVPADVGGAPRAPALVIVNGSDGAVTSTYAAVGHEAVRRGYVVLYFDGPGQQSMLFEHGTSFRPDFEQVLTPVLDWLLDRPEIDPDRVAAYGISQAGYWLPRALAAEHRVAAAIADPAVVDVSTSWSQHIPKFLLRHLDDGRDDLFDKEMALGMKGGRSRREWTFRARPYGTAGYADTMHAVRAYRITPEEAARITTPLLLTDPENEQFWPGQTQQLADMATGTSVTVEPFGAADGADLHCEPLARRATNERLFDWLESHLAGGDPAR
jgi:dienelactone hydrolase